MLNCLIFQLVLQRQRTATLEYLKLLYEAEGFEEAEEFDEKDFQRMLESKAKMNIERICKGVLDEIIRRLEIVSKMVLSFVSMEITQWTTDCKF